MLALGALGGWLTLAALGTTTTDVGPVTATVRIQPLGDGVTVLDLPPVGQLTADTHGGPLRVTLAVREVSLERAQVLLGDPTALDRLPDRVTADVTAALQQALLRAVLVAALGGGLLVLLVTRGPSAGLLGAVVGAAFVAVPAGVAATTVDTDALQEPTFSGLLAAAPELVAQAQDIAGNVDAYGDQLAAVVTHVTRLYETGITLPTFRPAEDTVQVLHISDLHLNPTAWDLVRAVADQYDVDVIVDTGDIADQGTVFETRYVEPIGTLGRPYLFVKGNHDSTVIEAAVAAQPNAVVVDGSVQEEAGLRWLGIPDPRFTPDSAGRESDTTAQAEAMRRLAAAAWAADPPVDVLLAHDPTDAEVVADAAPLLLAGHGHRRHVREYGDTLVLVQGSTGGAGLRALEDADPTPVTLSVLYFDAATGQLQAWDDITLGGLGLTTATIQRTQAERAAQSDVVPDVEVPVEDAAADPQPGAGG